MVEAEDVRKPDQDDWMETQATVTVENIGGIDTHRATFEPGCTILKGRNATNRTSLLSAIADVLGGTQAALKSDAKEGQIELTLSNESYSRRYARRNGGLHSEGNQYTDRQHLVDLFVHLREGNPIRRGVERGDDLRELLMRPVDTEQIERDIQSLEGERSRVESRLEEIERERDRLPALDDRRNTLESDLADVESDLEAIYDQVDSHEADEAEAEQAEALVDELEELRDSLGQTETRLANREDELDRLHKEREEAAAELKDISVPEGELESVADRLRRLRREGRSIDDRIDSLERIVAFNEDLLAGEENETVPTGSDADAGLTAELDPTSKTVECWTCGSTVERQAIADRLEELRAIADEHQEERREVESEIADLEEEKRELSRAADAKADLESRLDDLDRQIELQESEVADLEAECEEIREEIAAVEDRVGETEALRESDLVEQYRRLSKLEYERGRLEQELDDITEEIEEIKALAEEADQLEAQREEIREEIRSLRSRIDDLEREAVDQFNEHMEAVLAALGYENLARVWIERRTGESEESEFELHVVRETAEGAVYEDVVDNLSESEREVVGLVVALAGYFVHDVYEVVPFILLDSLEAIDSERIAALVTYFADYAPYLVVALLPKDAAAFPEEYERIPVADLSP
jgi:DNA repair exonuclease SbcCD ATPase subunit